MKKRSGMFNYTSAVMIRRQARSGYQRFYQSGHRKSYHKAIVPLNGEYCSYYYYWIALIKHLAFQRDSLQLDVISNWYPFFNMQTSRLLFSRWVSSVITCMSFIDTLNARQFLVYCKCSHIIQLPYLENISCQIISNTINKW